MALQQFESIGNWQDLLCRNPMCSIFMLPSSNEDAGGGGGGGETEEGGLKRLTSGKLSWFMMGFYSV